MQFSAVPYLMNIEQTIESIPDNDFVFNACRPSVFCDLLTNNRDKKMSESVVSRLTYSCM